MPSAEKKRKEIAKHIISAIMIYIKACNFYNSKMKESNWWAQNKIHLDSAKFYLG